MQSNWLRWNSLSGFERQMLALGTARHPMTSYIRVVLSSKPETEVLRWSLSEVAQRHRFIESLLEDESFQRQENLAPTLVESAPNYPVVIDIRKESGVRCYLYKSEDDWILEFAIHHCTMDGNAVLGLFLPELLLFYRKRVEAKGKTPEALKVGKLGLRHRVSFPWTKSLRHGVSQCLRKRPEILQPKSQQLNIPDPVSHVCLDSDLFASLKLLASENNLTVNDLVVAGLLESLIEWCGASQGGASRERVSLACPVDLRPRKLKMNWRSPKSESILACSNLTCFSYVTTGKGESVLDIAKAWNAEKRLRDTGEAKLLLDSLQCVTALPKLLSKLAMAWLTSPKANWATAVLSDMGNPLSAYSAQFAQNEHGEIELDRGCAVKKVLGVPPVTGTMRAAFATFIGHKGELSICVNADPETFGQSDVDSLLNLYLCFLTKLASTRRLS